MIAVLLVAGYATRLYPLTKDKPKSLLPLGNKLIIDYILSDIDLVADISSIVLDSNGKFASQFEEWANGLDRTNKAPIKILNDKSTDDTNKLGAIGDIIFAMKQENIDEDLMVMAGDNIFTYDLVEMYSFFKQKSADTLVAIHVEEKHQLQKLAVAQLDDDGKILDMIEKPSEPKTHWGIYATYFYKKETLPLFKQYIDEGNSPDAPGNFPSWLYKRQPVYAYKANGTCVDIGTVENYNQICKEYEGKQ